MTIGVDFDGTVVPRIEDGVSDFDTGATEVLKELIGAGHKIVLFTCRNNSIMNPYNKGREIASLDEAILWFKKRGIALDGVNVTKEQMGQIGFSRKPLLDVLIDDTALGTKLKRITISYKRYWDGETIEDFETYCVDWDWVREELKKNGLLR